MPSLFEKAVSSIRMGVEDFRQQDPERDVSAVRNFYAGVLLLAKEALIREAPAADPMLVIGAKTKPVPDGAGGIEMAQVGHSTIDFRSGTIRSAASGSVVIDRSDACGGIPISYGPAPSRAGCEPGSPENAVRGSR